MKGLTTVKTTLGIMGLYALALIVANVHVHANNLIH